MAPVLRMHFVRLVSIAVEFSKAPSPWTCPVVQANKFELVINIQTAKTLGLTVPHSLIARADEVIK